jgi:hypothetical protein
MITRVCVLPILFEHVKSLRINIYRKEGCKNFRASISKSTIEANRTLTAVTATPQTYSPIMHAPMTISKRPFAHHDEQKTLTELTARSGSSSKWWWWWWCRTAAGDAKPSPGGGSHRPCTKARNGTGGMRGTGARRLVRGKGAGFSAVGQSREPPGEPQKGDAPLCKTPIHTASGRGTSLFSGNGGAPASSLCPVCPSAHFFFSSRVALSASRQDSGEEPCACAASRDSDGFVPLAVAVLLHVRTRRSPRPGASRQTGAGGEEWKIRTRRDRDHPDRFFLLVNLAIAVAAAAFVRRALPLFNLAGSNRIASTGNAHEARPFLFSPFSNPACSSGSFTESSCTDNDAD